VVELSNGLIARGHSVTIHHQAGTPCQWLHCDASVATLDDLAHRRYDALLLVTEWRQSEYAHLLAADAKIKGVCLMGFTPSEQLADMLRDWPHSPAKGVSVLADALGRPDIEVFADGPWQLDWIKRTLKRETAVAFGGVNTRMFRPDPGQRRGLVIGASGDPRKRKGTDTVRAAMAIVKEQHPKLELATYWGRGLTQSQLVQWYQRCTIFLDGHRRAGWCNPVFEAMACSAAVVCSDIGAVRPLAVHRETALLVPVDDAEAMAKLVLWLLGSAPRIKRLGEAAVKKARHYTYGYAAARVERYLEKRLMEGDHVVSSAHTENRRV